MILDHVRRYNRCFWTVLSLWWPILVLRKPQNALKMGGFGTKKWVKNRSKTHFSKTHPRPFGVHKRVKWAHFEPILGHFGPSEVQKALKVGLVVMGFTCKLISLCPERSMCESSLMALISHS